MNKKKTVVIGVSEKPGRYANIAVNRLLQYGHEVVPVGLQKGTIQNLEILTGKPDIKDVHTITLYIRPQLQPDLYNWMIGMKPERIIFNPGTENKEFERLAKEKGIEVTEACTLVLLSIGSY